MLDYAKMCPWKVGGLAAHTGVFLVQSDTPSTLMTVQLQLVGLVIPLGIPPRLLTEELLVQRTIRDFRLLFRYVKQTEPKI